jgi:co-chaperonin GroES (HSP10)
MKYGKLRPVEFNVIIELDPVEEKTPGGIIMTSNRVDRDRLEETEGTLIACSELAFTYADWPEGARKPQVGERVIFARYAGTLTEMNDRWVRVIKDKDIMAVF